MGRRGACDLGHSSSARRAPLVALAVALAALLCDAPVAAERPEKGERARERDPTRLIVKMRRGVPAAQLYASQRGQRVRRLRRLRARRGGSVELMEIANPADSLDDVIAELEADPTVEYAEPDWIVHTTATPNDPEFPELWGLQQSSDVDIDGPEAWDVTEGDLDVVVAVSDTGVDYTHPDLAANMWRNPGEIVNGRDDDGNGYVDDIHGIDCIDGSGDPMDDNRHGTHVAGTIGAVGNNGTGVIGVSPRVGIMALRFIGRFGGRTSDAVECLEYVLDAKARHGVDVRVVNASWGGGGFSTSLRDTLLDLEAAGVLFVAAAGNDGRNNDLNPHYPSSYDVGNVLAVAAIDRDDRLASFSNWGPTSVDLGAPGVEVLSTVPGNAYRELSGTSMATPHVSGAAALLAAHAPGLDVATLRSLILDHAEPTSSLDGRVASGGRLNARDILCSPGDFTLVAEPREGFRIGRYHDTIVRAVLRDCGDPITGGNVRVELSTGEPDLLLVDDGSGVDAAADDGIYTALWLPKVAGPVRLDTDAVFAGGALARSASGTVVDVPRYEVADVPFAWIDATAGGRKLPVTRDDASAFLSLGFDFPFYGKAHRSVRVSANGYLTFGRRGGVYGNGSLPDERAPLSTIAPYWDDLHPQSSGEVWALLEGTAPERRLTVQWDDFGYYRSPGRVTFQVTLYELDGRIVARYLDVTSGDPAHDLGASATVGIQNSTGEFGVEYAHNSPALGDGSAVEFSVDDSVVDATEAGVAGQRLMMMDTLGQPRSRRMLFLLGDPALAAPAFGGSSDPYRWGGALTVRNPGTGREVAVPLPREQWRGLGRGYLYRGPGPCGLMLVLKGRMIAICGGPDFDYALDEPTQGELDLKLELGAKTTLCATFGGDVSRDYGAGFGPGKTGMFFAAGAPRPPGCP